MAEDDELKGLSGVEPGWLDPSVAGHPGPHLLLLARLMADALASRDRGLCDVLDQAESPLHGNFGGASPEEWALVALARCAAKGEHSAIRADVVEAFTRAGIVDWHLFVEQVVRPLGGGYGPGVASFHDKEAYRWVRVDDLPVPHYLMERRLTGPLMRRWDELSSQRRYGWFGAPRTPSEVRERWVAEHTTRPHHWPLAEAPWHRILHAVRALWDEPEVRWTRPHIDSVLSRCDPSVALGVRSLL